VLRLLPGFVVGLVTAQLSPAASDPLFQQGSQAYQSANYTEAATAFRQLASQQPAVGTLQNLGTAEWQAGNVGPAIVAWEQAQWLDPLNPAVRMNLRFARKTAQLESPDLAWYEVISSWLPLNLWAWFAGISLWLALGMATLPGILRWRKAGWHQALAAFGLMVFFLTIPAQLGVHTRSKLGFVLQKDTPLRLTPTHEAQLVTRLAAGESARCERVHGNYLFVRIGSQRLKGWILREQFGTVVDKARG